MTWEGVNEIKIQKIPHDSVTSEILFNWVPIKDHEQARANIDTLIEQAAKEASVKELKALRKKVLSDRFDGDYFAEFFDHRIKELEL